MEIGYKTDGVYTIYPDNLNSISVYCEMSQGGWTRVVNRIDRNNNFKKSWAEFKSGFGDFSGNHWLGLENMRTIVQVKPTKVRFECTNTVNYFFELDWITIGSEAQKYQLFYGGYLTRNMSAINNLSAQNGTFFSAFDNDNDGYSGINCVDTYNGGWWYQTCIEFCITCNSTNGVGHFNLPTGWLFCDKSKMLFMHK